MSQLYTLTYPIPSGRIGNPQGFQYVGFASFIVLIWDHIDTFTDEVELIWKGKRKGLYSYQNRYFTPLGFIINLYVAIAVEVVGLMMLLRINALYPHQKWITRGLGALLIFETVVNAWLISRGEPVAHNPNSGIHACSMVFDPAISGAASASAWIPLLYDTIIFGLTLYRTVPPIRREEASYIIKRLLEDGLLYYSVIFSVTLVLTIMIVAAPPGTKNIAAQITLINPRSRWKVAMMSRITLNLKKAGERLNNDCLSSPKSLLFDRRKRRRRPSSMNYPSLTMSLPTPTLAAAAVNHIAGTALRFARPIPPTPNTIDEIPEPNESYEAYKKPPPVLTSPPRMALLV
ncbi:hypothetical protein BDZ97DRAFT_1761624 [Flammula alnicola]|nr:hypothetical protein BDZ97DRAFT_1761624 [Flammula alnicola]